MRRTSSRIVQSAGAVLLLALASACGGDDDDDATEASAAAATEAPAATAAAPATEAPAATAAPAATEAPAATTAAPDDGGLYGPAPDATSGGGSAPAAGEATVATADSDLGTILVDGEGRTLYLFMPDAQGPSTCTEGCLENWPALAGPATAGEGADGSLLATAARPDDGSEQVTYNGWPLYYFGGDAVAGDVNGQGLGDNWYVVDATGNAIGSA